VLLEILGVGGRRPVHKVKINVVGLEVLERRGNALFNALVPWVVELGGDPDFLTRHTRVLDTETNLGLVAVGESSVNVTVASEESSLDGFADLVGLGLPCTETNSWDFGSLSNVSWSAFLVTLSSITYSVEGKGLFGPLGRHFDGDYACDLEW
jgi:hypothetical protein